MNAISKAVFQSFEIASFFFIKLKSINKYNENTIAPNIALILISITILLFEFISEIAPL